MPVESKKGRGYSSPDGSHTWEYLAAFACSLQAFSIGYMLAWTSPTIVLMKGPNSPVKTDIEDMSNIAAAIAVGHALAPFIANPLIDRAGRKNTLVISGVPFVISWAMIFCATHIWVVIAARALAGIAFGACICAAPLYLGEIATNHLRGLLSSIGLVMLNLGILFGYIVIPYLTISQTALLFLTISVAVEIGICVIPESPYFLLMVGREEAAEIALEKFRGKADVSEELASIRASILDTRSNETGIIIELKKLFTVRANLRALFISTLFLLPTHFGGFVTILTFGHVIFDDAKTLIPRDMCPIAVAVTQLVSSIITSLIVDKIGRKPLIAVAGLVATICNMIIGGYFFAKEYMSIDVSEYSSVLLIAAMMLVFAFNTGLLSVGNVLASEIYTTDVKATGTCLTAIIGGIFAVIGQKMYLIVVDTWKFGHSMPFSGFSIITMLSTSVLLCVTPETKGKTFAEIQRLLAK